MRRTFKHRAYPTRAQAEASRRQLGEACRLYNAALDERRSAWRKAGEKAGYPRFRSPLRYDSLTYPSWGDGCALRTPGRLYLQGVGDLKVKWHRPLPAAATIKTVTIKREAGRWYVCFSVEMAEPEPLPASEQAVGIDMGLTTFAVLSDGTEIANPRYFRAAERLLRIARRKLTRRKNRSRRRQKAPAGTRARAPSRRQSTARLPP